MPRRMEQVGSGARAINTSWLALAPTAGHKFEVLECSIEAGGTAGRIVFEQLVRPELAYVTVAAVTAIAGEVVNNVHNAVVVYAGDEYRVSCLSGGASSWRAVVTYMDVTFD